MEIRRYNENTEKVLSQRQIVNFATATLTFAVVRQPAEYLSFPSQSSVTSLHSNRRCCDTCNFVSVYSLSPSSFSYIVVVQTCCTSTPQNSPHTPHRPTNHSTYA